MSEDIETEKEEQIFIDHSKLLVRGERFYPLIEDLREGLVENSNCITIVLPAQMHDELIWEKELLQARKALSEEKKILWELDFGFQESCFSLADDALFNAQKMAIEIWNERVWKEFEKETLGLVLFRGSFALADLLLQFELDERMEEDAIGFFQDNFQLSFSSFETFSKLFPEHMQLYCVSVLSEYLHRFLAHLPMELAVFFAAEIPAACSSALAALLLSKKYFEYMHPITKMHGSTLLPGIGWGRASEVGFFGERGKLVCAQIGLVLPEDALLLSNLDEIEKITEQLTGKGLIFRLIPEALVSEQWDGLNTLIFFTNLLSVAGKRQLQGFAAAGGELVATGLSDTLSSTSFSDFLAQAIS